MPGSPDRCPPDPDEIAELYVLGHLSPADTAAFEDHIIGCAACATVAEDIATYVKAMKGALSNVAAKRH